MHGLSVAISNESRRVAGIFGSRAEDNRAIYGCLESADSLRLSAAGNLALNFTITQ
jgi:hypothetical protein